MPILDQVTPSKLKKLLNNPDTKDLVIEEISATEGRCVIFSPNHSQLPVIKSEADERWIFGGKGLGKDTLMCMETIWHALGNYPHYYPINCRLKQPNAGRYCTTNFNDGIKAIVVPELKKWAPPDSFVFREDDRLIQWHNKSTTQLKSFDQDIQSFAGQNLSYCHVSEHMNEEQYDESKHRLRVGKTRFLGCLTPKYGLCFDDKTEILSELGWMKYNELRLGDRILTLNKNTMETEFKQIDNLYVYPSKLGLMTRIRHNHLDALVTENHKWPVIIRGKNGNRLEIKETKDIKSHHRFIRSAKSSYNPEPVYSDELVYLIGMIITDGSYKKDREHVNVYQSYKANPDTCEDIQKNIDLIGAKHTKWNYEKEGSWSWTISGDVAKEIRNIIGPKKNLPGYFIMGLSSKQRQILYDSIMAGDGKIDVTGQHLVQKDKPWILDGFEMLCALMGKATCRTIAPSDFVGTERVHVKTSTKKGDYVCASYANFSYEEYCGPIWCPHTENETVIARRNGTVYISSNSWEYNCIYEAFQQGTRKYPELEVFGGQTHDNLHNLSPGYLKQFEHLTPDEKRRALYGEFVSLTGLVYPEYRDWRLEHIRAGDKYGGHLIEPFDIPSDWPRYMAIDPHPRKSFAMLWLAVSPDNDHYYYDEFFMPPDSGYLVSDYAQIIKDKEGDLFYEMSRIIDCSARANSPITGTDIQTELAKNGIRCMSTRRADKAIDFGINSVRDGLTFKRIEGFEDKYQPKIKIFDTLSRLRYEFRHYVYDSWVIRPEIHDNVKEKPRKREDDLLDCCRYLCNSGLTFSKPQIYTIGEGGKFSSNSYPARRQLSYASN